VDLEQLVREAIMLAEEARSNEAIPVFEVKARAALPHYLRVCRRVFDAVATETRSAVEPLLIALVMTVIGAGQGDPWRHKHLVDTARTSTASMGADIAPEVDRSVTLVCESSSPVIAVAGAFEEFLWRCGYGFETLKQLQYELLRCVKPLRFAALHETASITEYRECIDELEIALTQSLFGSVSVALCRFENLSSNHQRALSTRYTDDDIYSLRTLLIEADELRANLGASRRLEPAFPDAFARHLSWIFQSKGVLAARRLLRESRNVRYYPAGFEIGSLDALIIDGAVSAERVLEVIGERSGPYEYILTVTPKSDAPLLDDGTPFSEWNVFAMNFAMLHETIHLAWSAWNGLPQLATSTHKPTFVIPHGSEGPKINIALDGAGMLQITLADKSLDEVELAEQVKDIMQRSYILRHQGDPRAAIRVVEKFQHDLAEEQKTLDSEERMGLRNALGGALVDAGRAEEAIEHYRETLTVASVTSGPASELALIAADNLAWAQLESGHEEDALKSRRAICARARMYLGPSNPHTHISIHNLALAELAAGNVSTADELLRDVLVWGCNGMPTRKYVAAVDLYGSIHIALGQPSKAFRIRQVLVPFCVSVFGRTDQTTVIASGNLKVASTLAVSRRRSIMARLRARRAVRHAISSTEDPAVAWRALLQCLSQTLGEQIQPAALVELHEARSLQ
jgi:tetratricopeptide (TPR) repeat protein